MSSDRRDQYIKTANGFFITPAVARVILAEMQHGLCHYCGVKLTWDFNKKPRPKTLATLDHKIPTSKGGKDSMDNAVCACNGCNFRRGDISYEEFKGWFS